MRRVTSNQFANNAMWKFADMISNKLILLVITILLARLITPEAYGVVALTMVFIGFSDIFILNGFNIALIRKETVDEIDYSTVTAMSLVFTVFMYMIFFVAAPYIANFYKSPDLCLVLRVITILLFFKSIVSVIRAKGTRELQFKRMVLSAFAANTAGFRVMVLLGAFTFLKSTIIALCINIYLINLRTYNFPNRPRYPHTSSLRRQHIGCSDIHRQSNNTLPGHCYIVPLSYLRHYSPPSDISIRTTYT